MKRWTKDDIENVTAAFSDVVDALAEVTTPCVTVPQGRWCLAHQKPALTCPHVRARLILNRIAEVIDRG